MNRRSFLLSSAAVGVVALSAGRSWAQAAPLTILGSVPSLSFPFFVHMLNQIKAQAQEIGGITLIVKNRDRRKGILMLVMAAVLLANVAIWTL